MSDFQLNFLGINTVNFDKMLHFYTKVMKLGIKHSKPGWAAFQTVGMKLELFSTDKITHPAKAKSPTQSPVFIGFETQNIEQSLDWIKSKNVLIIENLAAHSWGKDFYFNDPDGNIIQIAQYN